MARLAKQDQQSAPGKLYVPKGMITFEQFVAEVDTYIPWCNEKRIKISLGSLGPVEYRQSLGLIL